MDDHFGIVLATNREYKEFAYVFFYEKKGKTRYIGYHIENNFIDGFESSCDSYTFR